MARGAWWATVHRVTKRCNLVTKTTLSNVLFSLCISEFMIYIIFLFSDELLTFLPKLVYWQQMPSAYFSFTFERWFQYHRILDWWFFTLSFLVDCMVAEEVSHISYPCSSTGKIFPFWLLSKKFCLLLNFCLLHMIYLGEDFWGIYLKSCSLEFLISVVCACH